MKIGSIELVSSNIVKYIKNYVPLAIYLALAFRNLPWPIIRPGTGLDSSWVIGMNLAFSNNFQFGKDIAFTYGVLGFLGNPLLLDYTLWKYAFAFQIFLDFFYTVSLYLFLRALSAKWYHYIMLIPFLLLGNNLRFEFQVMMLLSASIYLYIIILRSKSDWISSLGLFLIGIILSVISLIKFSLLLVSIYLILMTSLGLILRNKEVKQCIYLLLTYILSFASIWRIAGQDFINLKGYFASGFEISKGYNDAMGISGPGWQVYLGLASIFVLGLIFLYFLITANKNMILFFILNLFSLFSFFKLGFVRQDGGHLESFFLGFIIFFGLLLVVQFLDWYKEKKTNGIYISTFLNIVILLVLIIGANNAGMGFFSSEHVTEKLSSYELAINMLSNRTLFESQKIAALENVKNNYPMDPQLIKYIDRKTVDIFPWDIALCWAYGMKWSPRPIFQSYSAYTASLDDMNSQHFIGVHAPQAILYAFKSIDGRYPLFDEPATFRTILRDYVYVNSTNEFALLGKNISNTKSRDQQIDLGKIDTKFGTYIPVPKYSGGFVFGHIELSQSLLGTIVGALYKPSPIYIQFKFIDGSNSSKFRLISDDSKNGLFLSEYIENIDDLSLLFKRIVVKYNIIDGIYIETDQPEQYDDIIKIEFNGMPTNISEYSDIQFARLVRSAKVSNSPDVHSDKGCINDSCRPIIFEHPNGEIFFDNVTIPKNAILKFGIALDPQVWSPEKGDGVLFEIEIREDGTNKTIFSEYIDPKNHADQRKWNNYEVNLSPFIKKKSAILLKTSCGPKNNCTYDWAWWGNPTISS